VRVVVDVHEAKSGIAEMLAEFSASVERASLPAGDYVGAETLIERTRVLDLHAAVLKAASGPSSASSEQTLRVPFGAIDP